MAEGEPRLHLTPTSGSWLNLSRSGLASNTRPVRDLTIKIRLFIEGLEPPQTSFHLDQDSRPDPRHDQT